MAALSFEGVTYAYPGAGRPALAGVDLDIEPGQLVLLVGASGSGKSTLLRAALGLVPHFHGGELHGRVCVAGLDTREHRPGALARHVGLVFQDPESQLVMGRPDREAAFGLENLGHPAGEIAVRAREALAAVGAAALAGRPAAALSGGEAQRVAIAAVLAMGQPILLLDEPTSQLDPVAAEELLGLVVRINRDRGVTVVLAEHRTGRLFAEADRVLAMEDGRLTIDAPPPVAARALAASTPWALPPVTQAFARAGRAELPLTVRDARSLVVAPAPAAAPPLPPAAAVAGVVKAHKRLGDVDALAGATTAFERGRVTALVGENGAGKTTLARAACGLLELDRGRVDPAPARAGYVGQDPAHYLLHDTARDEVAYALRNLGVPAPERARRVEEALARLGLDGLGDRHPRDLSSGERQRVAIAAVTVMEPELLVLDEPTRGVDGLRKGALVELMRTLAADGTAVVVVTHDMDFAAEAADAVTSMAAGLVLSDRAPRTLLASGIFFVSQLGLALGRASQADAVALLRVGELGPRSRAESWAMPASDEKLAATSRAEGTTNG
jgi:energy-coupling factor transport system ATP-binding protein